MLHVGVTPGNVSKDAEVEEVRCEICGMMAQAAAALSHGFLNIALLKNCLFRSVDRHACACMRVNSKSHIANARTSLPLRSAFITKKSFVRLFME